MFDFFKRKRQEKTVLPEENATICRNVLKENKQSQLKSNTLIGDVQLHNADSSPFIVYTQGVRAMNCMYIEVSVYTRDESYFYTVSGGSTHMDGFALSGQIPPELVADNCMVLGKLLSHIDAGYNIISCTQHDNYALVDFSSRTVHLPTNTKCAHCGKLIEDSPDSKHEPFCINGEVFCKTCFRIDDWRQVVIKETPFLEIGKRSDKYFYYATEYDSKDSDICYTEEIPSHLLQHNEVNIDELIQHIIKKKDDYSSRFWKDVVAPYSFNVITRDLHSPKPLICSSCGTPIVDKNLSENCVNRLCSPYDKDRNLYCQNCKTQNNWSKPMYTVDLFGVDGALFDYTIHIGKTNKRYACYISTEYMSEQAAPNPIFLPSSLIENDTIRIHTLLKYLKSIKELEYLPDSYCDNYYSFNFARQEIEYPAPHKCSKCGTSIFKNNIFNGILDCTDSICSVDNAPVCVDCYLIQNGQKSYYIREREKMIFLMKYDVPEAEKWICRNADKIAIYLDPRNGRIYMDYLKQGTVIVPLKQIAINAMLDKAKEFSLNVYEKYKDMNCDNWNKYI